MSTKIFVDLGPAFCVLPLRARAEINSHFGASAGRADARRRDEGDVGHRRGAATKQMPARRRAPSGCGPQARWLCCSLLTYRPGYSSSLAPRQRAWGPAAKCEFISARALRTRPGKRSQRQPETLDSNRQQYSGFPRRDMTVFSPPNYKFSPKLKFILVLVISAAQGRVSQYTGSKHVFRLRAAVRTLGGLSLATRLEFEAWDFFDSV